MLQDRAVLLRKEVGGAVLEKGKAAFRRQDWPETIAQLGRFLSMDPAPEDALEASFFLGNAYFQSRKFEDAIKHLTRFIDGDKKAKLRDFAMMMLMQSYDMTGARDQAVAIAKEAFSSYPAQRLPHAVPLAARSEPTVPAPLRRLRRRPAPAPWRRPRARLPPPSHDRARSADPKDPQFRPYRAVSLGVYLVFTIGFSCLIIFSVYRSVLQMTPDRPPAA